MNDLKAGIKDIILLFRQGNLSENALTLFQSLGYATDRQSPFAKKTFKSFKEAYLVGQSFREEKALVPDWKYADLLFQLSGEEIKFGAANQGALIKKEVKTIGESETVIKSYLFFAIGLSNAHYSRTELSQITREMNKVFPMPVMILFKHGKTLSISIINRRLHKRDDSRDVLEKVTLIKDISIEKPHRAHIEILFDLSLEELRLKHKFSDFVGLHSAWQKTLDTKELNKKFYSELFNWYLWAKKNVKFPQIRPAEDLIDDNIHQSESLIRLLTRLLFCWFMKEKGLIKKELFNVANLNEILKNFKGPGSDETIYYKAILQNLFFATLNKPILERKLIKNIFPNPAYGDPLVYRYTELFKKEEDILRHFENIPFLNGGLFDCLDSRKDKGNPVEIRLDGFSKTKSKQPIAPDKLFFGEYKDIDLSGEYDDKKKSKVTVHGLIDILNDYKFTIEENTPIEEEIALDPELLGKVFENLLASYNPDTLTAARKQTGSFYTPREIVNYMVDESLKAYLKQKLTENKAMGPEDADVALGFLFEYSEKEHLFDKKQAAILISAIDSCKVLDPACGSGAFPMGVLQKLIHILRKVDHDNKQWFEIVISKFPVSAQSAMRAKLEHENWDYVRKLGIIQECIYGVDIQPIAIQISKLRFFITLLVDQNEKPGAVNRGFEALPNLDFKLVAANTLIGAPETDVVSAGLFAAQADPFFDEFDKLTGQYFSAYAPETKKKLKEKITILIAAKCDEKVKAIKNLSSHHDERFSKTLAERNKNEIKEKEREVKLWNSYKNLFKQEAVGFFEPKYFFPKAAGGFDVVIGNPPYIFTRDAEFSDEFKEYIIKRYSSMLASKDKKTKANQSGKINLFALFILRGLSESKNNGVLTYIVPNNILRTTTYDLIRKYLLENSVVAEIVDLGAGVFDNTTASTIILRVLNSKNTVNHKTKIITEIKDLEKFEFSKTIIAQNQFLKNVSYTFNLFADKSVNALLSKISENKSELGGYCVDIIAGIDAPKHLISGTPSKKSMPLLEGKIIKRYGLKQVKKHITWDIEEIHRTRPDYLWKAAKKIIIQRISGGNSPLTATIDTDKYKTFASINNLLLKPDYSDYYEFILALLNSKVLNYFYANSFSNNSTLTVNISKTFLEKLPIASFNVDTNNCFKSIVNYVLILRKNGDSGSPTFSFYEYLIDAMVYELYFPQKIKNADAEVLKHLTTLPELKDDWSNDKKLSVIEKVYKELSSPAHPVSIAMVKMQEIPEVKIIEGREKE